MHRQSTASFARSDAYVQAHSVPKGEPGPPRDGKGRTGRDLETGRKEVWDGGDGGGDGDGNGNEGSSGDVSGGARTGKYTGAETEARTRRERGRGREEISGIRHNMMEVEYS